MQLCSREFIRIVGRCTTEELGGHVSEQTHRVQVALQVHRQTDCRVHVSAAHASDKEDDKRKGRANDKGISAAGKDGKNKKEGTNVLREIGLERDVHSTSSPFLIDIRQGRGGKNHLIGGSLRYRGQGRLAGQIPSRQGADIHEKCKSRHSILQHIILGDGTRSCGWTGRCI